MSASNVLEEFLVSIIWKDDEASQKKIFQNVEKLEKGLVSLAAAATAATIGIVAAMSRVATSFEDAFYQSSRAGGTINELKAVQFAAAQTGASAQAAGASINSLMDKIRASGGNNGGFAHLIKQLTGDQSTDWIKQYSELLTKLHNMRPEQAAGYANVLGISAEEYLSDPADRIRQMEEFAAKAKALGIDLEKAGRDGKEFAREYRDLGNTIGLIGDKVISKLIDDPDKPLQKLSAYLTEHGAQIADILERIGKAFLTLFDKMAEMLPTIDQFVEKHGGWEAALAAIGALLLVKVVPGLTAALGLLKEMSLLLVGTPLGRLLLLGGAAYMGAQSFSQTGAPPLAPSDDSWLGQDHGGQAAGPVKRWWKRHAPSWLGGGHGGREGFMGRGHPAKVSETTNAIADELRKAGLGDEAIAAVLGSMQTESSFRPGAHNDIAGGHDGLIQWDSVRWPKIVSWIKSQGGDPMDPRWQTRAFVAEGRAKPGDPLYDTAKTREGFRDLEEAGNDIHKAVHGMYKIERFGAGEEGGRAANAEKWLPHVRSVKFGGPVTTPEAKHNGAPVPMPKGWPPKPSANPYGGFDPDAMRPLFAPQALGTGPEAAKNVTIHQNNVNNVSGVSDPTAAAGQIGAKQDRHSSMLLRNLQSAIV